MYTEGVWCEVGGVLLVMSWAKKRFERNRYFLAQPRPPMIFGCGIADLICSAFSYKHWSFLLFLVSVYLSHSDAGRVL